MTSSITQLVFETHALSEDNEAGRSTGWHPGRLSAHGRALARELGARRRYDRIAAVFVSDLRRATQTAEIAFDGCDLPILHDWRLRECDYGDLNGGPSAIVHTAVDGIHDRFPNGESWHEAIARVASALVDVHRRWRGQRVLLIGHMSSYWALEHCIGGMPLEAVGRAFEWQEGWEYELTDATFA